MPRVSQENRIVSDSIANERGLRANERTYARERYRGKINRLHESLEKLLRHLNPSQYLRITLWRVARAGELRRPAELPLIPNFMHGKL